MDIKNIKVKNLSYL